MNRLIGAAGLAAEARALGSFGGLPDFQVTSGVTRPLTIKEQIMEAGAKALAESKAAPVEFETLEHVLAQKRAMAEGRRQYTSSLAC